MISTVFIFILALLSAKFTFFAYFCIAFMLLSIIFALIAWRVLFVIKYFKLQPVSIYSIVFILFDLATLYIMTNLGYYTVPLIFMLSRLVHTIFISPREVITSKSGDRKLSEIILKFANPLMEKCNSFEDEKNIIALSILAWNTSISDVETKQKKLLKKLNKIAKNLSLDTKVKLIKKMIERKNRYYNKHNFKVIAYRFKEIDDNSYNLRVLGTFLNI